MGENTTNAVRCAHCGRTDCRGECVTGRRARELAPDVEAHLTETRALLALQEAPRRFGRAVTGPPEARVREMRELAEDLERVVAYLHGRLARHD